MSLTLVPSPIGHNEDWTLRSIKALESAELVIVEEFRQGSTLLKQLGIKKPMESLNEHSDTDQVEALRKLCETKNICLMSDCGTPNFCDPGYQLIKVCRESNIPVKSLPGSSSLMTLLSLSSEKLKQFVFLGFLAAEKEERKKQLQNLKSEKRALVLMDTPYRFHKLLLELAEHLPQRKALITLDLTQSTEQVFEGSLKDLSIKIEKQKAEFLILIYQES